MSDVLKAHIRQQTINNVIINMLLNGGLAWWLLKEKPPLTAFGESGYGIDMLITGFLLAGLVAMAMIKIHQVQLAKGMHQPVAVSVLGGYARLPTGNLWACSGLFALAGMLASAALVGVLLLLALPPFDPPVYAVFKAVWAGILAGLVVPPAVMIGLCARE